MRKTEGVCRNPTVRVVQAESLWVWGRNEKEKGSEWRKEMEQTTARLAKQWGINIEAALAESKSRSRWQVAVCCSALDYSLNGKGQQVPCVSSKGLAGKLYAQVNKPQESKVGSKQKGKGERHSICLIAALKCGFTPHPPTGFNNEWPVIVFENMNSQQLYHVTNNNSARFFVGLFWYSLCLGVSKRYDWCVQFLQHLVNYQHSSVKPPKY